MRAGIFLAVLAILGTAKSAHADKPAPPLTYQQPTPDGKYLFVMNSPFPLETELKIYPEKTRIKLQSTREKYPKSGLYKNDGSNEPIWTVDWYARRVTLSSDGVHLVRHGPWPQLEGKVKDKNRSITPKDLKQEAISFFAKGKLLRQYSIGELVLQPNQLRMSVSHFMWLKNFQLNDGKNQLEVVTLDGNWILFDIATAKIIEQMKVN